MINASFNELATTFYIMSFIVSTVVWRRSGWIFSVMYFVGMTIAAIGLMNLCLNYSDLSPQKATTLALIVPVLAFISAFFLKRKDTKKCPFCAEVIKKDALKCRYCQSEQK